jgi:hypothetical protein
LRSEPVGYNLYVAVTLWKAATVEYLVVLLVVIFGRNDGVLCCLYYGLYLLFAILVYQWATFNGFAQVDRQTLVIVCRVKVILQGVGMRWGIAAKTKSIRTDTNG